jgi:hypothetical protein
MRALDRGAIVLPDVVFEFNQPRVLNFYRRYDTYCCSGVSLNASLA